MSSKHEIQFESLLLQLKIPFEREYKFQQWRFDFAIPAKKIAFEIDGGMWKKTRLKNGATMQGGGHQTPTGFMKDCKKSLHAGLEGWRVMRIPSPWLYHTSRHKAKSYLLTYDEVKEIVIKLMYTNPPALK